MDKESDVEKYLHNRITRAGGTTRKWTSPGHVGVPDRICFFHGAVFFIEVKTDTGKLSSPQEREIARLKEHGADVFVVYGMSGVNTLVDKVLKTYTNVLTSSDEFR